jgi:hypothetical protein
MITDDEFRARIAALRRADRAVAAEFVRACKGDDPDMLRYAADRLSEETVTGWTVAIRKIARELPEVHPAIRSAFVSTWVQHKHLSLTAGDHRALCAALLVLMPAYQVPLSACFAAPPAGSAGVAFMVYRGRRISRSPCSLRSKIETTAAAFCSKHLCLLRRSCATWLQPAGHTMRANFWWTGGYYLASKWSVD